MARRSYKSHYTTNLSAKLRRRNIQWFVLAVVVLVILLFVLLKDGSDKTEADSKDNVVKNILPENVKIEDPGKDVSMEGTGLRVVEEPKPKPRPKPKPKPVKIPETKKPEPVKPVVKDVKPVETDIKPEPTPEDKGLDVPMGEAEQRMLAASKDIKQGKLASARDTLNQVLTLKIKPEDRIRIRKQLSDMSNIWLFSKSAFPGDKLVGAYQVKSGDNLTAIGNKYKVPAEFLMELNGIKDARKLRAGQTLKVVYGPFNAVISKSSFTLDLYLQRTYVKSYKVGTGLPGKETPSGKWRVSSNGKLIQPPWPRPTELGGGIVYPGDPEYPLGTHYIGLDGLERDAKGRTGFALHGTKEPKSIGTRSSQGCVRLHNKDIEKIYNMFVPMYSEIWVID